ncbi:hypothetical protein Tco_0225950, partial [Tanacetum coccineum]
GVTDGLETLGLVDEKNLDLSSAALVNSSSLKIKYLLPIWRVLKLYVVKCLKENYKNDKLTSLKPYHISATSFKTPSASEVALTSDMLTHAEESVATANATKRLEAFGLVEELRKQPKPADYKKVTILNLRGIASNHSQTSLGGSGEDKGFIMRDVDLENSRLSKDAQHHAYEIQTLEYLNFTQPQGTLIHNKRVPRS